MKKLHRACLAGATLALTVMGCQLVAGLEDRTVGDEVASLPDGGELEDAQGGSAGSDAAGAGGSAVCTQAAPVIDGGPGVRPPPRPEGPVAPSKNETKRVTLVARQLYLGTRDYEDNKNTAFWRELGFDFDRKCTTAEATASGKAGVCKMPPNAPITTGYFDGEGCRDNAFGGSVMQALAVVQSDIEKQATEAIYKGSHTLLLVIDDLDEGCDDPYAPASLYITSRLDDETSKNGLGWGGEDIRYPELESTEVVGDGGVPLDGGWTQDGLLPSGQGMYLRATGGVMQAKIRFEHGYVSNNVWVSNDLGDELREAVIPLGPLVLKAKTQAFALTVEFKDSAKSAIVSSMMGAVVATDDLVQTVSDFLPSLVSCQSPLLAQSMLEQVPQLADISKTGPGFVDPSGSSICDALSLGAAIKWQRAQLGDRAIDSLPLMFVCNEQNVGVPVPDYDAGFGGNPPATFPDAGDLSEPTAQREAHAGALCDGGERDAWSCVRLRRRGGSALGRARQEQVGADTHADQPSADADVGAPGRGVGLVVQLNATW